MAEKRISPIVKKSNLLCRASWGPSSIWEARLVALIASRIHTEDKDFQTYEIPIEDVITDAHSRGKTSYEILDNATDAAMKQIIKLKKSNGGWKKYNLMNECEFDPDKSSITVSFHPKLKPHYIDLKNNFARYDLTQFLLLPSTYSQRMFEILKSWDDQPEVEILLAELHLMLKTPKSLQSVYKNFRRRVLDKAYTDIHKYTSIEYEWEPIKKGRKVIAVRFTFSENRTQELAKEKRLEAQKANSQRNNKLGVAAVKCFESHGKVCNQENPNTKQVCEVCKMLHPK